MKKTLLLFLTLILISCSNHLDKKFNENELKKDLEILKGELNEKDFETLEKSITILNYDTENLEKLSYQEILDKGNEFENKLKDFKYKLIQERYFENEKVKRYKQVIDKLKVLRDAQIKYHEVNGTFTKNKIELSQFLDEKDKSYFNAPYTKKEFEIKVAQIEKFAGIIVPVFIIRIDKESVLKGLNKELIKREKEAYSTNQVRGEYISVGSLTEVLRSGNWPSRYD